MLGVVDNKKKPYPLNNLKETDGAFQLGVFSLNVAIVTLWVVLTLYMPLKLHEPLTPS